MHHIEIKSYRKTWKHEIVNCIIMLIENHPLHFLLSPRNFCKSDKWQTDDKDKTVKVANLLIAKSAKVHPNEKYFYLIV